MTEQTTIQELARTAQQFGPMWVTVILIVIYNIVHQWFIGRSANSQHPDIEKNKVKLEKHDEKIERINIELEKRVPFVWVETNILPMLRDIDTKVTELYTIAKANNGKNTK